MIVEVHLDDDAQNRHKSDYDKNGLFRCVGSFCGFPATTLPAADNPLVFRYRHREDGGFYPIFIVYFF